VLVNIFYIGIKLTTQEFQEELKNDYLSRLVAFLEVPICKSCKYGLVSRDKSINFMCGHSYHPDCVVVGSTCLHCMEEDSEKYEYFISMLNPEHPKIKRPAELFEEFKRIGSIMSDTFINDEYRRANQKELNPSVEINEQKKKRLENYDEDRKTMEDGNNKILFSLFR
jgi:hypothetical protein